MKKRLFNLFIIILAFMGIVLPNASLADTKDMNVRRISGNDRYDTAINLSKDTFKESKYAVIATGEDFADALIGGTLTVQIEAPMLLVSKNSISDNVIKELERLKVEKVFLLGGTSSISSNIENRLKELKFNVERIAGKDRFDTAEKIRFKKLELDNAIVPGDYYIGVDGYNFPDALAAAPLIGHNPGYHLIPFDGGNINERSYRMVFGGEKSVPKSESEVFRFAGDNRYSTAVEVAKGFKTLLHKNIDTIVLASGEDYPDALASASTAYMNKGALLLTNPKKLSKETRDYIKEYNIENIIIIGGVNSVSKEIEKELSNLKVEINPNKEKYYNVPLKIDEFKIDVAIEEIYVQNGGENYGLLNVTNNSKYDLEYFYATIFRDLGDDVPKKDSFSIEKGIKAGETASSNSIAIGKDNDIDSYIIEDYNYEVKIDGKKYHISYDIKSDYYYVDLKDN